MPAMDSPDITHPDPFFHRYLLFVERQKAFARGEKMNAFREESAFTEFLDKRGVRENVVERLLGREREAIVQERRSLVKDVAKEIGVTLEVTNGYREKDLAQLLCLYEWRKLSQKKPTDPVWGGPFPWREDAGFGE